MLSKRLVERLHKTALRLPGHAVACMVGGCTTDARWTPRSGQLRFQCEFCGRHIVPSLRHVLWECEAFAHLRTIPEPVSRLRARLGWTERALARSHEDALICQMGRIRQAEVESRRQRASWARPD